MQGCKQRRAGFENRTQRKAAEDRSCLACSLPLPSSRAVPVSQECSQGRQRPLRSRGDQEGWGEWSMAVFVMDNVNEDGGDGR